MGCFDLGLTKFKSGLGYKCSRFRPKPIHTDLSYTRTRHLLPSMQFYMPNCNRPGHVALLCPERTIFLERSHMKQILISYLLIWFSLLHLTPHGLRRSFCCLQNSTGLRPHAYLLPNLTQQRQKNHRQH